MTANSANFGGWSDLHVAPDGKSLSSISDEGSWLTATIDYDHDGNLAGLSNGRIGSLRGLDGKPLENKVMADAEGMALLPDGSWLVSFERHHRFWRYPTLDGTPTLIEGPADLGQQPNNGGVEAVTALADGRIIAISEEYVVNPGMLRGWIGQPAGGGRYTWQTFDYAKTPDFNPTALVQLPDGAVLPARARLRHGSRRASAGHAVRRRRREARRHGARQGAGLARLALRGGQSGGVGGPQGRARRDAALADLGRQLQSAPAQHPA